MPSGHGGAAWLPGACELQQGALVSEVPQSNRDMLQDEGSHAGDRLLDVGLE